MRNKILLAVMLAGLIIPSFVLAGSSQGNVITNLIVQGITVLRPSADTSITEAGGITVTDGIMRIVGDGGAIDITANPQIGLCDVENDGQIVIIQGTNDVNTVKLDNGTGFTLSGGVSFTLGNNDNLHAMCDFGESTWLETSRVDL